jgi:hypothetical protein
MTVPCAIGGGKTKLHLQKINRAIEKFREVEWN